MKFSTSFSSSISSSNHLFRLLFVLLFSLSMLPANGQSCEPYYPMDEGDSWELSSYNPKDKLQGVSKHKIISRTGSGDHIEATVKAEHYDKKDKMTQEMEYDLICKDGQFTVDMRSLLNPEQMAGMQNMEFTVESDNLAFPPSLSPGQTLPDASVDVSINSTGLKMGLGVRITNRKVLANEKMTTSAGTFDCYVITQDVESIMMMGIKIRGTSKTWFAKDAGAVRTESYNKNGKLMGYEVLTAIGN